MGNPLWFIFWLLVLLFLSFFVAFISAFFYIFIYLFSQCCRGCSGIADFLLKCVQFPGYCASAMLNCQPLC